MIGDFGPYPNYRDSRVAWLGHLPEHWDLRALRSVATARKGKQPEGLAIADGEGDVGLPYLSMDFLRSPNAAAREFAPSQPGLVVADSGDVILLWDGANAGEFLQAKAGVVSSTCAWLQPMAMDRRYLFYACKVAEPTLRACTIGMGIPHVDGNVLKNIALPVPPMAEQIAIVRFLGHVDRRMRRYVSAKQKMITLMEEERQAIIERAVTRGLDPTVRMRTSGVEILGDVPEHWDVVRAARVCDFLAGKAHEPFIDPNGEFICVTARFVSTDGRSARMCSANFCPARTGDVLMVMSDLPRGRALARAYYVDDDREYAVNQRVCVLRAHSINSAFLAYSVNRNPQLLAHDDGFNQTHLPNAAFKTMKILVPPSEEQEEIVAALASRTGAIDSAVARGRREIELLMEYRTRLINDVVTGKLDVREAAASLSEEVADTDSSGDLPGEDDVDDQVLDASDEAVA